MDGSTFYSCIYITTVSQLKNSVLNDQLGKKVTQNKWNGEELILKTVIFWEKDKRQFSVFQNYSTYERLLPVWIEKGNFYPLQGSGVHYVIQQSKTENEAKHNVITSHSTAPLTLLLSKIISPALYILYAKYHIVVQRMGGFYIGTTVNCPTAALTIFWTRCKIILHKYMLSNRRTLQYCNLIRMS